MNLLLFFIILIVSFIAVRIGAIAFQLTGLEWSPHGTNVPLGDSRVTRGGAVIAPSACHAIRPTVAHLGGRGWGMDGRPRAGRPRPYGVS